MSETEVTSEVQFENSDDLDTFSQDFFGQKPKEDKSTPTKVDVAQDDESQTPDDTDAQKTDDEQDEAELKEEIPDKPKKKTVQDRIDEVVRQREETKRELSAKIDELERKLQESLKGTQPAPAEAQAKEPTPDAVDKDGNPIYALGEFDPQYIRDLTRFAISQEQAKVQAEQAEAQKQSVAQQEQQALQNQWNEKLTAATQEYPDLIEKGQTLLNGFNNLDDNYAGYLSNIIMSMEKGPDVLYYLANHPEEAAAIVNSGAQKATLALGRIEARFTQDDQQTPKTKVSKAPPPPPVRARGTNGAFISVAPDTDDLKAFEAEFFQKSKLIHS